MLYILQFSSYVFSLVTVPYQTRVLGPVIYGKLGFATAMMVYFQLFIDFGFLLSATEDVSKNREDRNFLSKVFTSVTCGKLFLSFISAVALLILCLAVPGWKEDIGLYFLFLLAAVINSFLPDYLYRGMEQMTIITVRTVAIKLFFTIMIFLFLKSPSDYYVVPLLNIIGNFLAVACTLIDLARHIGVRFCKVSGRDIWYSFRRSSTFFYSRIAGTIYTAGNTILLQAIYPGSATIGYYSSADKVITTAKNGLSPISDSLYPYMVKNKDFKLIKKILVICMPIILVGCLVVGIWAEPICRIVFGSEFTDTAGILQRLLPIVAVTLPSYILGFPTMSPVGLAKYANYSVVFSASVHVLQIVFLFLSNHFNVYNLCTATSITAIAELAFRIVVIYKNRHLYKERVPNEKRSS